MPYISKDDIARAKEMDLLTYLQNYEPWELKHIKGNVYQTVTHDSLKISNGKWMWWSEGVGGRSALDYLVKVREMSFTDAVQAIIGEVERVQPVPVKMHKEEQKSVLIPTSHNPADLAMEYLTEERGIDEDMMYDLIFKGDIYETEKYHNAAFVGRDNEGNIKCIALRSIDGDFKNTTSGSDRKFPFRMLAKDNGVRNNVLHLFEAPIDALSYATLMKSQGIDYKTQNLLALCGIYQPKEKIEESAVPVGVVQYLKDNPWTKTVCLHLDNDGPGRKAAAALGVVLGNLGLKVINQPPPEGYKDCNDFLLNGSSAINTRAQENNRMEVEGR